MGFFDFLSSKPQEQRTQCMFYDDGSFQFRKLPFEDSCLVEKKDRLIVKAFKHFYSSELRFDGYTRIPADMVTLGFDRDFILDPFNKIKIDTNPNAGKPSKDSKAIHAWTAQVAEAQRYKVMNKPTNQIIWEKITMWLGIALILELLLFGVQFSSRYW